MKLYCAKKSNACSCNGSEQGNPLANLSSEAPDREVFLETFHYGPVDGGGYGWCEGPDAETVADCRQDPEIDPCDPPCVIVCPDGCPPRTDSNPSTKYYNVATSCTFCGVTYNLAAGIVVSTVSQADADARARSVCMTRVIALAASTKACQHIRPGPPVPPPPAPCTPESGSDPPTGAEAFRIPLVSDPLDPLFGFPDEIDWETFNFVLADVVETPHDPGSGTPWFQWGSQPDHPPGTYQLAWVSGLILDTISSAACFAVNPAIPFSYLMQLWLEDNEKFWQTIGASWLCDTQRDVTSLFPPPPPPINNYGIGVTTGCVADAAAGEAFLTAWFNGDPIKRWATSVAGHDHTNTGGAFAMSNVPAPPGPLGGFCSEVPGHPMMMKVVQVDGCIQQYRNLYIQNWSTIGLSLSATLWANWDGIFGTRSAYTLNTCQWDETPIGALGHASVWYTQTHPTSPNGCGWIVEIYDVDGSLSWRGYKIIDNVGTGLYLVAATSPNKKVQCIRILGL